MLDEISAARPAQLGVIKLTALSSKSAADYLIDLAAALKIVGCVLFACCSLRSGAGPRHEWTAKRAVCYR